MASEDLQHMMAGGMRVVTSAADELARCPDSDTVFRQALALARRHLGVGRCGLLIGQDGSLRGTYRIDRDGTIIDERARQLPIEAQLLDALQTCEASGARWTTIENASGVWIPVSPTESITLTPIRSAQQRIGVFVYELDAREAASQPLAQEMIALFCSFLGLIIERKRVEKALGEERTLLRTLVNSLPDYIFAKDLNGNFILSNKAHARAANVYDPETLIGKTAADFYPPHLASQYETDDEQVMRTGQPLFDVERETLNAARNSITAATTKVPLRDPDGNVIGLVGISRDISAYKRTQEALKEQQAFLRQIIDTNPNLIFVKDWDGRYTLVNKIHAEMMGTTVEDMIGKRDADFNLPPEEVERFVRDDREVMTTLQPKYIPEERQTNLTTGESVWLRTIKVPMLAPDGQSRWVLGVASDVTEHRHAEEARHESESLRIALDKEKELSELKTRLMITISHEFRTPLSIAYTSAELLEKYFDKIPTEQRNKHLRKIESQISKMTDMIEDISILIHGTFDPFVPKLAPTDLTALCEAALAMLADSLEAPRLVVLNVKESLPALVLDEHRIRYAITNLLTNAIKYSDAEAPVTMDVAQRDGDVIIQITDEGIGIPAGEQTRVFEPFYRASNVGTIRGLGLGLSVATEIVELHGGEIRIESLVNHGTQVTITLPVTLQTSLSD